MRRSQTSAPTGKEDYDSDLAFLDSESETEVPASQPAGENQLIVDKILGRKFIQNEEGGTDELYFIKWKGMSYLHASWERREDIEQVDLSAKQKIKRFLQLTLDARILGIPRTASNASLAEEDGSNTGIVDDEEFDYYNPEMVEVQRIISCNTIDTSHSQAKRPQDLLNTKRKRKADADNTEEADSESEVRYLVKWRGLSYDECTWERWEELKDWYTEVWLFWQTQRPPRNLQPPQPKPPIQDYKKLDASPSFGETKISELLADSEGVSGGLMLRDYQLEGVNWLLWNWWHKRSCILADEMGLGKTIQTICFLHQLRYMPTTNINGPFLLIAPLSLVDQWQSEIATWSPDMNTVLLHGNVEARNNILNHEFYYQEPYVTKAEAIALKRSSTCKFHILLTTFEVAVKEIKTLMKIPWRVMIIDEAHRLKNPTARLFSTLATINAEHTVLLTGTPLQNKTEELWALLNFAERKRFVDMEDFMRKFGDLKDASQVASLHDVLRPYLLRRIKEDVEKSLPPKEETIVEVALTSVQKRFYRAIFEKNTVYLYRGLKASNQPCLINVMMELRKCCNHPYLVRGVEERVIAELPPDQAKEPAVLYKSLIESSGKLVLLDKLLPSLQSEGHKVLIFSQMVRVLNILEDFLKYRGYLYERLDGTSRAAERKEAVDRFCKPSMNRFIMLLSTKAGGLGLNLVAADTVIIYDSDWNPQNDLQAQARAHRIGQTKSVMVYRLLTRKTYEMHMFHQASLKLGLDRAVLAHARIEAEEERSASATSSSSKKKGGDKLAMSTKEIDELLKRGAYDVFREDDSEQKDFVEADIESILQRRAHKVVYDGALSKAASSLGNFSKASFVSADEKEDVDINDPDFWKKAVGLKENTKSILDDTEADIELPQQRSRKQTTFWNGIANVDEEQLKELLKPVKNEKSIAEKKIQSAQKKEAAMKERQEREEAKKAKLIEELKVKGDPRNWGAHNRDRVLRCVNLYGFGRWERIKNETGKSMMETKDLESFTRAYVLQCGICASTQELSKSDTAFVRDTIEGAKRLLEMEQAGEKELNIPPSLQEERFLVKLRGGMAKKALNKLDTLVKLLNMVRASVDDIIKAKGITVNTEADIDAAFSLLSTEELSAALPLGDVRPSWTRTVSWWDLKCDRHLVVGVFKHGYGKYDLVKEDDDLVFKGIIAKVVGERGEFVETAVGAGTGPLAGNGEARQSETPDGLAGNEGELGDNGDNDAEDNEGKEEGGEEGDQDKEDGDMDMDVEGGGEGRGHGGWPDPRHLNRLLTWLVTAEEARMTKEEYAEKQRSERKAKAALAVDQPTTKKEKDKEKDKDKSKDKDKAKDKEKEKEEEIAGATFDFYGPDTSLQHAHWIKMLGEHIDYEAIASVHKALIQGIKKCEYILSIPVSGDDAHLPKQDEINLHDAANPSGTDISISSIDKLQGSDAQGSPEQMEMDLSSEQVPSQEHMDKGTGTILLEYEAVRLSATLILRGAPLMDSSQEDVYSWRNVRDYSQVRLSEEQIVAFYLKVWLPFCEKISSRKSLSTAQNKYIVPNPVLSVSEHHFAARGLCHTFLVRQQVLYAVNAMITTCRDNLVEYLRSSAGRNVDNMPVWWCPWIHDLGLLMGINKFGFIALKQLKTDDQLPFTQDYLRVFISRVFLLPPSLADSVARFDLRSKAEAESFVQSALLQFPEVKDLELRVCRIVDDMAKFLPPGHLSRINLVQTYRSVLLQQYEGNEYEADKKELDIAKFKPDGRARSSKPPAVSLKMFVHNSRKRRRLYLTLNHPECFVDYPDFGTTGSPGEV